MKRLSIYEAKKLAAERKGKCLSEQYIDSKAKLAWECQKGHRWHAPITSIKRGYWCPYCGRKKSPKYNLKDVRQYAEAKNAECLSTKYNFTTDMLSWRCEKGHIWESTFSEIKRGSWCPLCANENHRVYDIEFCRELARSYYGKCLSQEYKNTKSKLRWVCEFGHTWNATLGNVKDNGSWCPQCSQSYGERKFRTVLETITGHSFPKVRPPWLLNERGNRMEIDGFCSTLKVGFEYQGRQHLEYIPHWHKRKDKFLKQKSTDALKESILSSYHIKMLYPTYKLKPSEFETFILKHLDFVQDVHRAWS